MSPILSSCGNAAAKSYGMFSSVGIPGGWLTLVHPNFTLPTSYKENAGTTGYFHDLDVPNNKIVFGHNDYILSASRTAYVTELNLTSGLLGNVRAHYIGTGSFSIAQDGGVKVDSSGNRYSSGYYGSNTGTFDIQASITKFNSSGALVWSSLAAYTANNTSVFEAHTIDSTGAIIAVGYRQTVSTGASQGIVVKFNASGTIAWQRSLAFSAGNQVSPYDVTVDSSNNVYLCGAVTASTVNSATNAFIVKYNSSGTLQSQVTYGFGTSTTFTNTRFNAIKVDSSGNIYAGGFEFGSGSYPNSILIKYNSSLVLQWTREVRIANTSNTGLDHGLYDIQIKGSYIYGVGDEATTDPTTSPSTAKTNIFYIKYDLNGNVIWRHSIRSVLTYTKVLTDNSTVTEYPAVLALSITPLASENSFIISGQLGGYSYWPGPSPVAGYYISRNPVFIKINEDNIPLASFNFGSGADLMNPYYNIEFYTSSYTSTSSSIAAVTNTLVDAAGGLTYTDNTSNVTMPTAKAFKAEYV
jgi:hypothetical protein